MTSFDFKLFCRDCDIVAELVEEEGKPDMAICPRCSLTAGYESAVDTATDYFNEAVREAISELSTDYMAYYRPGLGPVFVLK